MSPAFSEADLLTSPGDFGAPGLGDIKIVDAATFGPGCCVLTGDTAGPFLDLGRQILHTEPRAYIHVPFVKEMGRAVGMVDGDDVDTADRLEELETENAELLAENAMLKAKVPA